MYIDTHCHLDFYLPEDIPRVIERANKERVLRIVANGVNPHTNRKVLDLASLYRPVLPSLGLYPTDALQMTPKEVKAEIEFIKAQGDFIIALGEIGMDFKESQEKKQQAEIFEQMIILGMELKLPLIVHSRKAEEACIELLESSGKKDIIMHCFSGSMKLVDRIVKNKWYLTIPTCVTNSEHFQHIIKRVPLTHLLCETDSPFLHPMKEKNNEPANVVFSYEKIALLKRKTIKDVEKSIQKNFIKLFGDV